MAAVRTGLIGWPVAHSLSPAIHGHWLKKYGIEGSYDLFPIDPAHMETQIKKLKISGLRGFNVTVPHKETVIPFLDTIDETAHQIGAVNTVIRDGHTWRGTNTDAYGFIEHLRHSVEDLKKTIAHPVIIGAGGAARAAIHALQQEGAKNIFIANRSRERAQALAASFGGDVRTVEWKQANRAMEGASLLVQTTSCGMQNHAPLNLSIDVLSSRAVVYDVVYSPLQTPLLSAAKKKKYKTVDGLGMLLYQAQLAFKEWHGILPDVDKKLRHLVLTEIKKRDSK